MPATPMAEIDDTELMQRLAEWDAILGISPTSQGRAAAIVESGAELGYSIR